MLNIAICGNTSEDLKAQLESFTNRYSIYVFKTLYQCEESPTYFDVYIIFSNDNIIINNERSYFIFVGDNFKNIIVNNNICNNYFVKGLNYEKITEILNHIKRKIQKSHFMVRTSKGSTKVALKDLKYIDIRGRNLCYHLELGEELNSLTLTTSFYKAIEPLIKNESLLFLKPSILVNLNKIKTIGTNYIIFEDEDILYLSNPNTKKVKEAWEEFYQFENR